MTLDDRAYSGLQVGLIALKCKQISRSWSGLNEAVSGN
jgi:hypothetical protein